MIEAWTVTWKSPNHLYVHCCGVLWFDQSNLQMRIRAESTLYLTGDNFSINSFIWNFSVVGECDLVFLIVSDTGGKAEWMLAQVTSAWPEGTYGSWLNVILDNCRRRSSVVRQWARWVFSVHLSKEQLNITLIKGNKSPQYGYTQEFWTSTESYKCNNCSLAAPSLEVDLSDTTLVLGSALHSSFG